MRVLIQRVLSASVIIGGSVHSKIGVGLLVLLGIEEGDGEEDISWLVKKTSNMRLFPDDNGVMNLSINDINGEILVVSQFTLHASVKKGNRPSYIRAAKPEISIPLYEKFVVELDNSIESVVRTGNFGADMKVDLINDGPVTIFIDSKNRE